MTKWSWSLSSSGSFISYDYVNRPKLKMDSATGNITIASSSFISLMKELCSVKISLFGDLYTNTRLLVLANLCHDIILGQELKNQHSRVSFNFIGTKKVFCILNSSFCSILSALVDI